MENKGRQTRYYQRSAFFQLALIITLGGVSGTITMANAFLFLNPPLLALLWIPAGILAGFAGVWLMVYAIDDFREPRRSRRGGQPHAHPLWALAGWAVALVGPPIAVYLAFIA